ncbi:hypothetical protein Y032_0013g2078 [Ancylostoma ceylanicum]|uniref:Uncharacterized protein n=1 Tax=Ancylostoma ceylanicum TaxID=53326 RepID=A0A016VAN4_9BILA|nr:hypothetical protein Y032_0013g2078 [Ancylostoma ceylanicum]
MKRLDALTEPKNVKKLCKVEKERLQSARVFQWTGNREARPLRDIAHFKVSVVKLVTSGLVVVSAGSLQVPLGYAADHVLP